MPTLPSFPVGDKPTVREVADWVELTALMKGTPFKRGDLKSAISQESIGSPDLLEEQVWNEIVGRSEVFAARWPLKLASDRLRPRSSVRNVELYKYLCVLGLGQLDAEDRTLFEEVVEALLSLPMRGNALRIGAPASQGLSGSFRERVTHYANSSGLLAGEVLKAPLSQDKDLGLDVVSWLPFSDRRGGYLHFLIQCATGADWEDKLTDIDLNVWMRHINWAVPPVRVFSVPMTLLLTEDKWIRVSDAGGLVLDRPRLHELAEAAILDNVLRSRIKLRFDILIAA